MSMYQYWIGKNINFDDVWKNYNEGVDGYAVKYHTMKKYVMVISFDLPTSELPLFAHEAVYKTLKGYYHELKQVVLSSEEYNQSGPLFLYEISRGSSHWTLVGEIKQLVLLAISLLKPLRDQIWFGTNLADEELKGKILENTKSQLEIVSKINELFPQSKISESDLEKLLLARKNKDLCNAIKNMITTGGDIKKIEISKKQLDSNIDEANSSLLDVNEITDSISTD